MASCDLDQRDGKSQKGAVFQRLSPLASNTAVQTPAAEGFVAFQRQSRLRVQSQDSFSKEIFQTSE